ncbi:unnamed protein product [Ectocarpus sp. CCAP 1310/34]|nr:unnamed protein product [Ectocarpus sp. CCAP 1310/34]
MNRRRGTRYLELNSSPKKHYFLCVFPLFSLHLKTLSASTCYLELDSSLEHMLFVNYWDSVVGTMPLTCSGLLEPGDTPPPETLAHAGLRALQANRQSEPHAHAIVLDPYFGKVAFIPDLGMLQNGTLYM